MLIERFGTKSLDPTTANCFFGRALCDRIRMDRKPLRVKADYKVTGHGESSGVPRGKLIGQKP